MNEKLINYLKEQMAPKQAIIADYCAAQAVVSDLKAKLAEAEAKVATFADITKVEADLAELQGFVDSLTEVAPVVPAVETAQAAPTTQAQPVTNIII